MKETNSNSGNASNIQCIEVLIAKNYLSNNSANLFWTLSVYSLENHPVRTRQDMENSELFRFMVYDWRRTIKKLLETHKVPYSIVHYFVPATIYADQMSADGSFSDEARILHALEELHDTTSIKKQVAQAETEPVHSP